MNREHSVTPRVYRSMLPEESGLRPRIANDKKSLGVQVAGDGAGSPDLPVNAGKVKPNTGGMSVSPSKATLPLHRIPRQFGAIFPEARGSNSYVCWRIGDGPFVDSPFAPGLFMRVDRNNENHGLIEPDSEMPLDDYRQSLAATQPKWLAEAWDEEPGA